MAAIVPYSHRVREEAFNLYCQDLSTEKIARRIPELFGDETRPDQCTIKRWIKQNDWRARRDGIHRETEALADQNRVRTTAELQTDMNDLREKVLDASNSLKFKSAEGAVRSLATVRLVINSLTQPKEGTISKAQLDSVVGTILQVLQQDEVLGPVLAGRQTDILARIETLLKESSAAVYCHNVDDSLPIYLLVRRFLQGGGSS